ncbi:MAG: arylsulfatase [Verrucomicrobiota bacterium]
MAVARIATAVVVDSGATSTRPNIIYILADDLGYGDVSALNPQGKIKTPHLDRLAAQGMTFTEAHSTAAVCTPSRYSILTGRYNWRSTLKSGVLGGFGKPLIEPGQLTVAELLRQHGYQTACLGKWHLGLDWERRATSSSKEENDEGARIDFTKPIKRGPTTLGFDYFFGISASLDMPPYVFIENDRVTALPTIPAGRLVGADGEKTRVGPQVPGFEAVDVLPTLTRKAIEFIEQNTANSAGQKPFFLYLPLPSPHTPTAPTKEWLGKSGLSEYADFVMQTDDSIGQILATLERNNIASNTVVIFTSDNGCAPASGFQFLQEHGHDPSAGRRGHKADIFDGGHRIPLLVRWPAHVPAGSKSEAFVSLVDFIATCADLLSAKLPDNAGEDSIRFLPQLLSKSATGSREVLVESSNNGSLAIREAKWKLVFCPDSGGWSNPRPGSDSAKGLPRLQLYDQQTDPAEKTNLVSQHPEVVQRLGRLMRDYIRNGRSTPGVPQQNAPTKQWPQTQWLDQFADVK